MLFYSAVLMIAFLVTFLLTPAVKILASRIGAVDQPGERKIHGQPVPRLGGLAIYLGFLTAMIFALLALSQRGAHLDYFSIFITMLGALLILILGMIDDYQGLSASLKFLGQLLIAAAVVYFGIRIGFISNPFSGTIYAFPNLIVFPLTVFWIVGLTNAINLIDGLDGLAVGISGIAAISLFVVALRTHQIGAAVLLLALFGASLAFLKFNFFPASIFLGDSGSYLLGFLLAVAAVLGVLKSTLVIALLIPILILGVPIFDTLSVVIRRLAAGQQIFKADMRHIHHQLLRAGLSHRTVVLAIYLVCLFLSLCALIITAINAAAALVLLVVLLLIAIISWRMLKNAAGS